MNGIILAGGLGNQLFQLARVLEYKTNTTSQIILVNNLMQTRNLQNDESPLSEFMLNKSVKILDIRNDNSLKRICGYLLKNNAKADKQKYKTIKIKLIHNIAELKLRKRFKQKLDLVVSDDIGYSDLDSDSQHKVYLGYFQSFYWAAKNQNELCKILRLKDQEAQKNIDNWVKLNQINSSLIVHVRLGDYKNEKNFGIPSINYYHKSITDLWQKDNFSSICLYSDEISDAIRFIPDNLRDKVQFGYDKSASPAQVLQSMRYGRAYVIGNSTFAWWAAFLAHTSQAIRIAPSPWFIGMESPRNLIPDEWEKGTAWDSNFDYE